MATPKQNGATNSARTGLLIAAVLAAGLLGMLSWRADGGQPVEETPGLENPLLSLQPTCALERAAAGVRARELEALADASWERAPYAASDAALAVWNIAQASACNAVDGDREARQRVEQKRTVYERDFLARWHRTSLMLEIARRAERSEEVRRHVATLLALSERSGEDAAAYRRWLRAIDGEAASALAERAREVED